MEAQKYTNPQALPVLWCWGWDLPKKPFLSCTWAGEFASAGAELAQRGAESFWLEGQSPWIVLPWLFLSHIPLGLQREKVGEV